MKISDAELEVLKIIWNKEKATSLDIIDELSSFNWKDNTIRTLIKRLLEKDVIEIVEKNGKTFIYKSKINKEEYKYIKIKSLLNQLFDNDIEKLLSNYLEHNTHQKSIRI